MLDLKYVRENAEAVTENSKNRGVVANVGLVVELADRRSELMQELNELRQRQNALSKDIPKVVRTEERQRLVTESKAIKQQIPQREKKLTEVHRKRERFQDMAAEGLLPFDELRDKVAAPEETREIARRRLRE